MKIRALETVTIGYPGVEGVGKKDVHLTQGEVYENLDKEIVQAALDIKAAEKVGALDYVKKIVSPEKADDPKPEKRAYRKKSDNN